jgi:hypothetical protein
MKMLRLYDGLSDFHLTYRMAPISFFLHFFADFFIFLHLKTQPAKDSGLLQKSNLKHKELQTFKRPLVYDADAQGSYLSHLKKKLMNVAN